VGVDAPTVGVDVSALLHAGRRWPAFSPWPREGQGEPLLVRSPRGHALHGRAAPQPRGAEVRRCAGDAGSCAAVAGRGRRVFSTHIASQAFKSGDVRLLICTDVAARGLDIRELPYVINMTLPDEPENYIHRIGRVGKF
jgi:hypothetical protein